MPSLKNLNYADIPEALRAGWRDFRAAPTFGLFFGAVFTSIGIVILLQLILWETTYWALPIVAGFPLIGPFLAAGFYEVSRVLSAWQKPDWLFVVPAPFRRASRQAQLMTFVALFLAMVWFSTAHPIFALSFGLGPLTNVFSSAEILLSFEGILMLTLGIIIEFLAVLLFAVSVISIPILMDRDIDVVTAMVYRARSVPMNRGRWYLGG